ncbi:MAG: adenosylcobinamide-GDP ribazoletransferase [Gammaproteobacteria bacterium]|jgi:adenosylcobinamide-GDP ribazoletransferase|nr:adenosylcobinamide-GDP ribazoletransferase [Gammaproteobacteria bacterium]
MGWRDWWHSFLVSLQFLTSIPVHKWFAVARTIPRGEVAGNALLFYPLAGLILGTLLVALATLLPTLQIGLSPALQAGLLLVFWVMLTGALHLDGLGDAADAWLGGLGDQARTLAIMKDPTSGPVAIVVLVLLLLLKWLLLTELIAAQLLLPLLLVPVLARLQVMALIIYTPYVRGQGMGSDLKNQTQAKGFWVQLVAILLVLLVGQYWQLLGLVALALLAGYYWRRLMIRRLQGWTGDTAGASIELTECVLLLGLVGIFSV